jgi:glutamate carboxypeptidase
VIAAAALALEMHALNDQCPGLTVNVAQIDGGGPTNIVPDAAVVRLNVRLEKPEDQDWFIEQLENQLQLIGASHDVNINAHGSFTRPPKPWSEKLQKLFDWLAEQGNNMGLSLKWQATGGVCDGNNLCAAGLPTVDTLGARGGLIHSDQEFVCVDSLTERIQLLTQCLLALSTEKKGRP